MMKDTVADMPSSEENLDRTVLMIFRAFAVVRLGMALVWMAVQSNLQDEINILRAVTVLEVMLLLIYLSLPAIAQRSGRFYLPAGLLWASLAPIVIQNIALWDYFRDWPAGNITGGRFLLLQNVLSENLIDWVLLATTGQMLTVLMAPLIIISWRYNPREIIWFCGVTALLDLSMMLVALPLEGIQNALLVGLVLFRTMIFAIIGWIINRLVRLQKQHQDDLLAANHDLRHYAATREKLVVSQERNRLARELHDTLAHTLSATTVQLEAIGLIWETQPEKARSLLVQATTRTREGLNETRRALAALRAAPVNNMGLQRAIQVLAASIAGRHSVQIDTTFNLVGFSFNPEYEHTIYRIVQEALNNAVQHASARQITVTADYSGHTARFSISDDGIGFDPSTATINGHYGLRGMAERARQINARLDIVSQTGSGTTITLSLEADL